MVRKTAATRTVTRPKYLTNFIYQKPITLEDKLEAVKSGQYNFEDEEIKLNELIKNLRSNPKKANKYFETVGLLNYQK
jgi:hypothetical protein